MNRPVEGVVTGDIRPPRALRYCFPGWYGPRHAGLGNELMVLSKAFLAARELGVTLLPTAWGLNSRGYHRYFGTSRLDFLRLQTLATVLPSYRFTESDYRATGEVDFDLAVRAYGEARHLYRKSAFVFLVEGLWGEFYAIRKAAPFVLSTLYATRHTVDNLYHFEKVTADRELVIAVNIRLTDFAIPTPETDFRGLWNTRVPLDWYSRVCRSLRTALGPAVTFYLVTDGSPGDLREFIEEFEPITHWHRQYTDISNLLILSRADALICSISNYSQWGAFLSQAPYFWYQPHLRAVEGRATIWGYLAEVDSVRTSGERVHPRGIPVDDQGRIPAWVLAHLDQRRGFKRPSLDLVRSGGVPMEAAGEQLPASGQGSG